MVGNVFSRLGIVFVFVGLLSGCVRFTPSREALNAPFGFDPAKQFTGIKSFYQYELEQKARLQRLIEERRAAFEKDPDITYRVGPGDKLLVNVKNFEEISKEYTVTPAGHIRLPFVGNLEVKNLSEDQIAEAIANRITDYVVSPQVSVTVVEYNANVVWVMGLTGGGGGEHGTKRGAYPLKRRNYSLVDLIIEIGDPEVFSSGIVYLYPARSEEGDSRADDKRAQFGKSQQDIDYDPLQDWTDSSYQPKVCDGEEHNQKGGKRRRKACFPFEPEVDKERVFARYDPHARIEIDLEELFGGIAKKPLWVPLVPGDSIFIPSDPVVQVFGEVKVRGTFRLAGGAGAATVRGGATKPFLLSAIIAARGLTYSANIHNIAIFRELQYGNKVVLNVDLENVVLRGAQDVRLRDGDIIWVPSQTNRFAGEHIIDWINNLVGTGNNIEDFRQTQSLY